MKERYPITWSQIDDFVQDLVNSPLEWKERGFSSLYSYLEHLGCELKELIVRIHEYGLVVNE